MVSDSPSLDQLLARAQALKSQLTTVGELRPGSLVEHYRKCGKPNCHCAKRGSRGHGPSWVITREVKGKTLTKTIPAGPAVDQARAQTEEYKRFRELVRQFIEVNEQICELRSRRPPAAAEI